MRRSPRAARLGRAGAAHGGDGGAHWQGGPRSRCAHAGSTGLRRGRGDDGDAKPCCGGVGAHDRASLRSQPRGRADRGEGRHDRRVGDDGPARPFPDRARARGHGLAPRLALHLRWHLAGRCATRLPLATTEDNVPACRACTAAGFTAMDQRWQVRLAHRPARPGRWRSRPGRRRFGAACPRWTGKAA